MSLMRSAIFTTTFNLVTRVNYGFFSFVFFFCLFLFLFLFFSH